MITTSDMNVITFDVETTHIEKSSGGTTALPYFGNQLVSIGYKPLRASVVYDCYYHSTEEQTEGAYELSGRPRQVRRLDRSQHQVRLAVDT